MKTKWKQVNHICIQWNNVFGIIIIVTTLQWNWIGNGYSDSNYVKQNEKFTLKLICWFEAWVFDFCRCHQNVQSNNNNSSKEKQWHLHEGTDMQLSCVTININIHTYKQFRMLQFHFWLHESDLKYSNTVTSSHYFGLDMMTILSAEN